MIPDIIRAVKGSAGITLTALPTRHLSMGGSLVGATPCGCPKTGQAQGPAPTGGLRIAKCENGLKIAELKRLGSSIFRLPPSAICFFAFRHSPFAISLLVFAQKQGRHRGLPLRGWLRSAFQCTCRNHSGKGFPFVSRAKGRIRSPKTNTLERMVPASRIPKAALSLPKVYGPAMAR
jgi:hypothetical protein